MKTIGTAVVAALLLAACAGHAPKHAVDDDEQAVAASAVPQVVRDAVQQAYPGATVSAWTREKDEGSDYFEAAVAIAGGTEPRVVDVKLSREGRIVEEEETIADAALPDAVRQALKTSEYAGHAVRHAERIVRDGRREAPLYELLFTHEGRSVEVVLDAQGRILRQHGGDAGEDEEDEAHESR
jgi:hypothetical protein